MKLTDLCLIAMAALALFCAGCTTLPGANDTTVKATATPVPEPALLGTWRLVSFLGADGGTVAALAGSVPLVTFTREGKVGGSVGCNQFTADYTVSGSELSIGPAASTMMYCSFPDGVMDQEQRVLLLLPLTAGYTVAGNILFLLDRSGNRIMTFERAAEPTPAPPVGTT